MLLGHRVKKRHPNGALARYQAMRYIENSPLSTIGRSPSPPSL
jgi:hypothetical protein